MTVEQKLDELILALRFASRNDGYFSFSSELSKRLDSIEKGDVEKVFPHLAPHVADDGYDIRMINEVAAAFNLGRAATIAALLRLQKRGFVVTRKPE